MPRGRSSGDQKVFRTQSVSQVDAKTYFMKGQVPLISLIEQRRPHERGLCFRNVRIGWWHRLLVLKPDSILMCRVVGIWSLLRTLLNREYEPREYAVMRSVRLVKGLSVHSENGLTWNLHGNSRGLSEEGGMQSISHGTPGSRPCSQVMGKPVLLFINVYCRCCCSLLFILSHSVLRPAALAAAAFPFVP